MRRLILCAIIGAACKGGSPTSSAAIAQPPAPPAPGATAVVAPAPVAVAPSQGTAAADGGAWPHFVAATKAFVDPHLDPLSVKLPADNPPAADLAEGRAMVAQNDAALRELVAGVAAGQCPHAAAADDVVVLQDLHGLVQVLRLRAVLAIVDDKLDAAAPDLAVLLREPAVLTGCGLGATAAELATTDESEVVDIMDTLLGRGPIPASAKAVLVPALTSPGPTVTATPDGAKAQRALAALIAADQARRGKMAAFLGQ
jgi:hypothetical protein